MGKLTEAQRSAVIRRLERAILWAQSPTASKDIARHLAIVVVNDLDRIEADASATRRGLVKIIDRLEQTG